MILSSRHARSLTVLYLCVPLAAHSAAQPQDPLAEVPANQDQQTQENTDPQAPAGEADGQETDPIGETGTRPALELKLEDATRIANNNNLDLLAAEVGTEISNYDQLGSWGVFDWIFDANVSYTDATTQGSSFLAGGDKIESESQNLGLNLLKPLTTGGSFQLNFNHNVRDSNNAFFNDAQQTTDNLSLTYVQPLRRGAWSRYATALQRESEILFQRQVEVQRQTRQTVSYNVTLAYWELVRTRAQSGVADSAVELGQDQLEQEQRELAAGVGTNVDVVQAEALLATQLEDQLRARFDVAQRMDDLKRLLFAGKDEDLWDLELLPITDLPQVAETDGVPDWKTAVHLAMSERSELRQGRLDVSISQLRHTRSESERLSGLDLSLTAGSASVDPSNSSALSNAVGFDFPTYTALLSYNMPIGNRTANNAERAARAQVRLSQINLDNTMLAVEAEVRGAVRGVFFAEEQVKATATSLDLAQQQLEAEQARAKEGLSTTFQVLQFQQDLIEAMSNEANARAGFVMALSSLENAQGIIGEGVESGGGQN